MQNAGQHIITYATMVLLETLAAINHTRLAESVLRVPAIAMMVYVTVVELFA